MLWPNSSRGDSSVTVLCSVLFVHALYCVSMGVASTSLEMVLKQGSISHKTSTTFKGPQMQCSYFCPLTDALFGLSCNSFLFIYAIKKRKSMIFSKDEAKRTTFSPEIKTWRKTSLQL